MPTTQVYPDPIAASNSLAVEVAALIRSRGPNDRPIVFGLATGTTPLPFYAELERLYRDENLSFKNVITFNLDEYLGLGPQDPQSYWHFMHESLFDHIDVPSAHINIPNGMTAPDDLERYCRSYEQAIQEVGGIDLQILGIGSNGHIGFNEPGAARDAHTLVVDLAEKTRTDNAAFFDADEEVPTRAITMGCGTILSAKRIALMAWGERKAAIVREALHGPVTNDLPASFLQEHPDTTFYLDTAAASLLP